jgi:hypothetical protein
VIRQDLSQGCKDVSAYINKCNTTCQQNEGQKPYDHFKRHKKYHSIRCSIISSQKLNKLYRKRTSLKIIKIVYEKPMANIILNEGKLKVFPLKLGIRKVVHFNQ